MEPDLSDPGQKAKEKGKVRAMPLTLGGVPEDKQHVILCTHAINVVAGTKQVTTYVEARSAEKGTTMKRRGKAKAHIQEKVKKKTVRREKVAGSARDSPEPGGVATPDHPRRQIVTEIPN